jgi:L-ascorbate metabolism protein UlaG (beta-lactamase superfamily)
MQIQLVRSATLRILYGETCFLIDPYLAAKHTRPSYTGVSPNPLVDLPCRPQDVVAGIDVAVVSHLHSDHFDPLARSLLPQDLPLFCQPGDEGALHEQGFRNVVPVTECVHWQDISITRTDCQHGSGGVLAEMGQASGFVFRADNEPTLYWAGDTVWCPAVANTISQVRPQVIVTHSCGAVWGDRIPIVMDGAQTIAVCQAAPDSVVVATHMEALDHATVSRAELRAAAEKNGIQPEQLLIPADGERLVF